MKIKDIMTYEVSFVRSSDTIAAAARKMKDMDVGLMPVMDEGNARGLLTDRDIVIRTIAEGRDPMQTRVSDVMTTDLVFCYEGDDPEDVLRVMQDHRIRRVLVKNERDEITGVISLGDLAVKADAKKAGKTLKEVSQPARPARSSH